MISHRKLRAVSVVVTCATTFALLLSGCSTERLSRNAAAGACQQSAELAASGYANATSPAAQQAADAALDATFEAAGKLSSMLEGASPEAAANLRAQIESVRAQRTLADPLNNGISTLNEQKEAVAGALRDLGQGCLEAVNALTGN